MENRSEGEPSSSKEERPEGRSSETEQALTEKQKHLIKEHVDLFDTMGIEAPLEVIEDKVKELNDKKGK